MSGLTVYGCEPDEAEMFERLAPRLGVLPTITGTAVSEAGAVSVRANRCISVNHKSAVSEATLRALRETGVEYITTRSIGVDHIDLGAAARLGIAIGNAAYAPDGVADYALMLMLMALRNAKTIVTSALRYDFRLGNVRGRELRDLTVGVVGTGRIGQAVIGRLQGFGCRVLAYNSSPRAPVAADYVSLKALLGESDIVTLHLPHSADTHHFIGRQELAAMKPGALLVNTGRGPLVDTAALVAALESGKLGGAALDVIEGEEGLFYFDCTNRQIGNPLLVQLQQMPNVIITPHTAYHTGRVLHDIVEKTILNCLSFERSRVHG